MQTVRNHVPRWMFMQIVYFAFAGILLGKCSVMAVDYMRISAAKRAEVAFSVGKTAGEGGVLIRLPLKVLQELPVTGGV